MLKKILALCACFLFLTAMSPDNSATKASEPADIVPDTIMPPARDGEITADGIRLRSGPGTAYPVIATLNKGVKLRIIGIIRGWLVVLMPDDSIGMVTAEYARFTEPSGQAPTPEAADSQVAAPAITPPAVTVTPVITPPAASLTPDITPQAAPDSIRLFGLINDYRASLGLPAYAGDEKLDEAARLKAADMVKNNYFNHESPEYGSPFAMLHNMGVFYKTASENLARTASVDEAFTKMKGNLAHRTNLISGRYTHMGVGVAEDSNEPGKLIIVLLFTEV